MGGIFGGDDISYSIIVIGEPCLNARTRAKILMDTMPHPHLSVKRACTSRLRHTVQTYGLLLGVHFPAKWSHNHSLFASSLTSIPAPPSHVAGEGIEQRDHRLPLF
jgi:hypothetical protein